MRRLLLLRHAKTERAAPGDSDRARDLTARGRDDASLIGAHMARHGLIPDLALVSPAKRAAQTWALVAGAFRASPRVISDPRIYNAGASDLAIVIREAQNVPMLLVVGHNPGLHELALILIGSGEQRARERLAAKLPTCGLLVIGFPFDDWAMVDRTAGRLESFVSPRLVGAVPD